ncbi:DegT/DnrJ/EryC1/StrS family aminotransferase [soil metagenome]
MVDLGAEVAALGSALNEAIQRVIASGAFVRGPEVAAFEQELAAYMDGCHVVSVANGTDALQLAFMALGIGPGDEVIVPAFTFFATAEPLALLGATPVVVDIEPDTFNVSVDAVEAALTESTRAIVPVHLFGQPAQMDAISGLAVDRDCFVIEDTAQAIGARFQGTPAGLLGHVGTLSFYPSKNLGAYGDGGAVVTRSADLAAQVKQLANHGAQRKYYHDQIGVNSRLDGLHAAILRAKLPWLQDWTAARQAAATRYDDAFDAFSDFRHWGLIRPYRGADRIHVFHQYTVRVPAAQRDELRSRLATCGIPTMVYYPVPLNKMPALVNRFGEMPACPEAERAASEVLSLPMHPFLTDDDTTRVVTEIARFAGIRA